MSDYLVERLLLQSVRGRHGSHQPKLTLDEMEQAVASADEQFGTTTPSRFVYMIRAGESSPVKIGTSRNPRQRALEIQTSHYEKLSIVDLFPGGEEVERDIHQQLKAFRVRGEWFRPEDRVFAVFRYVKTSVCNQCFHARFGHTVSCPRRSVAEALADAIDREVARRNDAHALPIRHHNYRLKGMGLSIAERTSVLRTAWPGEPHLSRIAKEQWEPSEIAS